MACQINGNTVRTGITNFLDKELMDTSIFTKEESIYVAKDSQYFAAQEFVKGLNSRFSEDVIRQNSDKRFSISLSDPLVTQYINSSQAGQKLSTLTGMYFDFAIDPESWNENQTFQALNYPEISEFTYNQLTSFLKSLNPDFRIEEIDNLSVDAVTNVKDFLIKVKTLSKFQAMPEEVAHLFIELLPDSNPLKKEMISNITSYPIYTETLNKYKDTYLTPEGRPDYDKIKREAAAKLVGEYVTAIATDNHTRVQALGKPRQNWLQRWFANFMKWIGLGMRDHTRSYADIAGIILSGKTDQTLKNEQEIEDISYTDSYFFRLSETELYNNTLEIITARPPLLLENISKFSKEFGRRFNEILKDPTYAELNTMLKTQGQKVGKINRLSEIKVLLDEANIDLDAALDSNTYLTGIKQFLEAIDRLDILSSSILNVIQTKKDSANFDEAIQNIKELESYFSIYETFNNIISAEFAQMLIDSKVAPEVIESLQRTQLSFKNVNDHILSKLRNNLFVFYKGMLSESNDVASATLLGDIERAEKLGDQKLINKFKEKMQKLITNDETIIKMLSGKGRDIDNFSSINHLINASHTNGDVFLSSISRYIQNKIEVQQNKAQVVVRDLYQKIDPIIKQLNESAEVTGQKITFIDNVFDRDTGEERKVRVWLNPHKGIYVDLEKRRAKRRDTLRTRSEADPNSEEFKIVDAAYKQSQKEYSDFLEKYMHRPFVKEYYSFRQKYENDTDFITIMEEWKALSEDIGNLEDFLQAEPENISVWEDLSRTRRERSNLLNEVTEQGDPKSEEDLKKARILKQYFDESNKFKEEDEVQTERAYTIAQTRYDQQVDNAISRAREENSKTVADVEKSLQDTLRDPRLRITSAYEEATDPSDPLDYKFIKELVMERWDKKNVVVQRNEAFYEYEANLFKRLQDLKNKGELTDIDLKINEAYAAVRGVLFGSRDDIGEINPASLTEEDVINIIELEEYIRELKQDRPKSGANVEDFTPEDRQRFEDAGKVISDPDASSGHKRIAIAQRNKIVKKYTNVGTSKEISDLIKEIGSIKQKVPTGYYWDKMNIFVDHMSEFLTYAYTRGLSKEETTEISNFVKDFTVTVDEQDWDRLQFYLFEDEKFDAFLDWLMKNRTAEYNWFTLHHTKQTVFDNANGKPITLKWVRSAIYNYTEPTREEHGKLVYNRRFRKQRVKDEYRTGYNPETKKVELIVGKHITNREYNGFPEFMPLLPEDGAPANSPYHNQAYFDLKANDPLRFQYLTEVRNADLTEQDRLPSTLRRWNNIPVMGLSNIEELQPSHIGDIAKQKWNYVKSIFQRNEAGDAEAQAEGLDTIQEINQFTQQTITQRIPKLGMSQKLPVDNVSTNTLRSVAQMVIRAHEFEGRVEAEPVVKSLIRVMKDNEFKGNMSNKERAKKFESVFSQMILQEVPETTLNSKGVRRVARFITGNTALRMLGDPIGGVINYASAMVNNVVEASAGKYLNLNELAKGKVLAVRVNTNLMADYNKKANLSVDTLLFDTFDFIQGEFEEDLLDRASSKDKHASIRQMLMIPRKSGELMAQTASGMGILERYKVKNTIDGKEYPVHSIYTKDGNNLKLKEGFPQEYNPVDGEKFLKLKRLINRVNLELHGNYAKISQTEASRYSLGKLAENMKRWFMPAFQRRFGRETVDITFEDLNEGYYRTSATAVRNLFGSLFHLDFGGLKSWNEEFIKTPRYRQNLQRMGAELVQATILFITFALILGYSGDDKNKRLENNSWIHNTAILIALRAYSETTAYIPVPPFGFQELKRNALTPFSLPSDAISNFAAIAQLGLYQVLYWFGADGLKDSLYYQKDSGFWYSDTGDSKLFKYILNSFGHSGYHINPDQYIKQFSNLQSRLK